MGMAASQARFLGLTSRKSNVEYQGQQINQERTALSNESANLFNQMMSLDVPVPPSESDFYKVVYSLDNSSVDYMSGNYTIGNFSKTYANEGEYLITLNNKVEKRAENTNTYKLGTVTKGQSKDKDGKEIADKSTYQIRLNYITGSSSSSSSSTVRNSLSKTLLYDENDLDAYTGEKGALKVNQNQIYKVTNPNLDGYSTCCTDGNPNYYVNEDGSIMDSASYNAKIDTSKFRAMKETDLVDENNNPKYYVSNEGEIVTADAYNSKTDEEKAAYSAVTAENYKNADESAKYYVNPSDNSATTAAKYADGIDKSKYSKITSDDLVDKNNKSKYYVDAEGNAITAEAYNSKTEEEKKAYSALTADKIYTTDEYYFYQDKNNVNHFITKDVLDKIIDGSMAQDETVSDSWAYTYNEEYSTQVRGYLETSSNGRLTSIQIEEDDENLPANLSGKSFSLSASKVKDEEKYNDAFNEYEYEKSLYEKTVSDLNGKTEILQKEDKNLELKLDQLDTEQNAIKTEMDSVTKVIEDNIEKTFKIFA